jgi:hypothetical protein
MVNIVVLALLVGARTARASLSGGHLIDVDPDMATVKSRLLASYIAVASTNVSGMDSLIAQYLPLLVPPGVFSDLNYTAGDSSGWGGYAHCTRMAQLGTAYVTAVHPLARVHPHPTCSACPSRVSSWT